MSTLATTKNFYETDKAVSEYLLFHYGAHSEFLEQGIGPQEALGFSQRCGQLHTPYSLTRNRALDLGCAVGGASCELSKSFQSVVGIDFSQSLIQSAINLLNSEKNTITVATEGDLSKTVDITPPANTRPENINFRQGDAMQLPAELGTFDFILMANLIDRLPDPAKCLKSIHSFVTQNGILAITSPYTWLEEYTPKEKWLGGFLRDGNPITSFHSLKNILSPQFTLLDSQNMPFLIREHSRKNQFSIAHTTLWQKK